MIGKTFSHLTAVKDSGKRLHRNIIWECLCDCGNTTYVIASHLRSGNTKSCGCLRNKDKITHGKRATTEWTIWHGIKQRCYNPNNKAYKYYGGRGIFMCRRWRNSFENFYTDMGDRPKDLSIDRINNNGPYGKWNCHWATNKQQANNRG